MVIGTAVHREKILSPGLYVQMIIVDKYSTIISHAPSIFTGFISFIISIAFSIQDINCHKF